MARKKRRGSPPNRVYFWEKALVWISDRCNRAAAVLVAIGEAAYQFFQDNQSALMAACPFWVAAACLIVLGALYSSKKIEEVEKTDNTERRVV